MYTTFKKSDDSINERILFLEKVETATLSINSSFLLMSHAIVFYFYGFGLQRFLLISRVFAIIATLALMVRMYVSIKVKNGDMLASKKYWPGYQWSLWIYAACFSGIFHLTSIEHGVSSPHFVVMIALTTAYSVSILHTTSYDFSIYVPLQIFFITPQLTAYVVELRGLNHSDYVFAMLVLLCNHVLYIVSQYGKINSKRFEKFQNQVHLEIANQKLEESQKELLKQTQNTIYQSRLAALGEMAAGLSHEINNPLAIIRGNTELIQRGVEEGPMKDKLTIFHNNSLKAIERIVYIINGLKAFSRQKQVVEKESVPLATIIDETSVFCFEKLKAHNIQLKIDVIPEVTISCKPLQISQVLFSLVKNADDALMESPEINKWIAIRFKETDTDIHIYVSNNGLKISTEDQGRLFQPFFTSKAPGKGIGLALSISLGIVQEHAGELSYDQTSSETTFILKLPKYQEREISSDKFDKVRV